MLGTESMISIAELDAQYGYKFELFNMQASTRPAWAALACMPFQSCH